MITLLTNETYIDSLLVAISDAKKSIHIVNFKLESTSRPESRKLKKFFDLLVQKKIDGVYIDCLCQFSKQKKGTPSTNRNVLSRFLKNGIDVRYSIDQIVHAKIIIVDEKIIFLGSHNLSVKSVLSNIEASIVTDDSIVISTALIFFRRIFLKSQKILFL